MSTTLGIGSVMSDIINGIITVIDEIANTLAANASIIATVVITGLLAFAVFRYGSRIFQSVTTWFKGLF